MRRNAEGPHPLHYYLNAFKQYAVFTGRARRQEYWMFALFHFIAFLVLYGLGLFSGFVLDGRVPDPVAVALIIPFFLYVLASFVPALALTIRRLHDTGREGAWFFMAFIPFGVGAVFMMIYMCSDGNPFQNRFGPDPKGRQEMPPPQPGYAYGYQPYGQPGYPQQPAPAQPGYPQQGYPQQGFQQPGHPPAPHPPQPGAYPPPQQPPGPRV